jgi:ABC-type nitrate/sulfonate/bicarbonate transport system substrate-binding protein
MILLRRLVLAVLLSATASAADAKAVLRFGYLADPSHEAVLWALRHGKVTSDTVEIDATAMDIPAMLQATPARTFDVIETAALALPRARERGLDLRIVGIALRSGASGEGGAIWVKKDSPIHTVEDLKGKKIGVFSISSAGVTLIRIALAQAHHMNVAARGGDFEFIEVPPPAMPAALQTGRVDAATLIHAQAYLAGKTGDFRPVVETGKDLNALFGVQMVSAVLAGYGEKLDAKPALYTEFLRLLKASKDYALTHRQEVFEAVGKENDIDPGFFETWFSRFSEFPVAVSDNDVKAIDILYQQAIALKILDKAPTTASMVWSGALHDAK